MSKICNTCIEEKEDSEFYRDISDKTGLQGKCIVCTKEYNKQHKIKNPQYFKNYYEENKERHRDKRIAYKKKYREENPEKRLLAGCKSRAKLKNLQFNLSLEDITIPSQCPCCSKEIKKDEGQWDSGPSVDRIINSKGYINDNISITCWRCNRLKNDGTIEEFKQIIKYMELLECQK